MLPYRDTRLTRIVLGLFFAIVALYAYFEARGLLFGPSISLPAEAMQVTDNPYILIQGQVKRIASLSVENQPVPVTQDGGFELPYVLSPGVNRIAFDAKDKYGNATEKVMQIVYTPSATSSSIGMASQSGMSSSSAATSSPSIQIAATSTSAH